jgi:hypothetical protein
MNRRPGTPDKQRLSEENYAEEELLIESKYDQRDQRTEERREIQRDFLAAKRKIADRNITRACN